MGTNDFFYAISSTLQIDAVSLFLLYLVEMICSGLQIIYNTDEVIAPLKRLITSERGLTTCSVYRFNIVILFAAVGVREGL